MAKPSVFPEWSQNLVNDSVTGLDNKKEPTAQWKDSGQLSEEPTPRQYLNWTFDLIDEWLKYVDTEIDALNTFKTEVGIQDVITATDITLTKDLANKYVIMTGTVITLENVITVGGGNEQIGSTISVRTANSTTVSLNSGATRVGFTGTIPADRIATFVIETLPGGTGTQWSCAISAGA